MSALSPADWSRIAELRAAGNTEELWRMALTALHAEGPAACMAIVNALIPEEQRITRALVLDIVTAANDARQTALTDINRAAADRYTALADRLERHSAVLAALVPEK